MSSAARPDAPPKPEFEAADEFSVTVKVPPPVVEGISYRVEYKEYPEEWSAAKKMDLASGQGTVKCDNCNPCSTYNVRLVAVRDGVDSEPGPDAVLDTAAPGCTPKPKRRCVIS